MMQISKNKRRALLVGLVLVFALVSLRVMAPIWIRDYVENTLDRLDGYDCTLADVDLFLLRGAYQMEGLSLTKTDGEVPMPLLSAPLIDLSIQWSELWNGAVVGEMVFDRPEVSFVAAPTEKDQQTGADVPWTTKVKELFPFRINRLQVKEGKINLLNFHQSPKVDVLLYDLDGEISNLTNSAKLSETLWSRMYADGRIGDQGKLELTGELDPYAARPTFKAAFELEELFLPEINDLLRAYANLDAEAGSFAFYSEIESKDGQFTGYVKPVLENVDILRWQEEEEGFFGKLWEGIAEFAAWLLENPAEDRIASQVPIEGSLENPETDGWAAFLSLLSNAFVEAIGHGVEGKLGEDLLAPLLDGDDEN